MAKQKILRNNATSFIDEKKEGATTQAVHHWLLISAWLLLFFVLPLLFVWSSLGRIHVRPYGPSFTPAIGQFYTKSDQIIQVSQLSDRKHQL